MTQKIFFILLYLLLSVSGYPREGMWLPMLLNQNIDEMHDMGFKLQQEDVYSINHSSLKDAVVLFDTGCTGELVSPNGLLLTNYHCGYRHIQAHSSIDHDYLTDGFWAMDRDKELPNSGLSVSILIEMKNITNEILAGTDTCSNEFERSTLIAQHSVIAVEEATADNHYKARVKSFYNSNQYFLVIYEEFNDVRLVGAPPTAIGKFGGDTDNWMWPRHTGDFAIFRIYADSTNKPAPYSPNNIPYTPKKHLTITSKGFEEGDFTMVFGYPASTSQNLHSKAVEQIIHQRDPDRIAIRTLKLNIMSSFMEADRSIRIKYAAKYASTSNAWKKWQGEIKGLERLNTIEVKAEREKAFAKWVDENETRKSIYGNILSDFERLYLEIAAPQKAKDYYDEVVRKGTDSYSLFQHLNSLADDQFSTESEQAYLDKHFKDYTLEVDRAVFVALISKYKNDISPEFIPQKLNEIDKQKLEKLYTKSLLNDPAKLKKIVATKKWSKRLEKDQLYQLFASFQSIYYNKIGNAYYRLNREIRRVQKSYVAALLEMNEDKMIFPDANQTLRVSYGQIKGFDPADGVRYSHYTTIEGIMEKDNPEIYNYDVPDRLKTLIQNKDYGHYATTAGELPVCFTATNHTTGGNSGSPVLNAEGHLIGINFDRCWEGTMSDIMFDPKKCRNISLDMRYMLFLIDKFAGAGYLLDEMSIIH